MIYSFDKLSQFEIPKVILCNPDSRLDANGDVSNAVGQLMTFNAQDADFNFNALQTGNLEYTKGVSDNAMQNEWFTTLYNAIQVERYLYISDMGFAIITNVQETISGEKCVKKITWESCEKELEQVEAPFIVADGETKTVPFSTVGSDTGILQLVMAQCPQWTQGDVDTALTPQGGMYRTFENISSDDLYSFLMNEVQQAYECVVEFDCRERTISFYSRTGYLEQHETDINITHRNLIDEIGIDTNDDDVYTAISVTGDNELEIRRVNPVGNNILYRIPEYKKDWMPSALKTAVNRWQANIELYDSEYEDLNEMFYQAQMDFYKLIDDRNKEYENWRVDMQWRDNVLRMADPTIKTQMLAAANQAISIDENGAQDDVGYVEVHWSYNYESIESPSDWDSNKIYYVITNTTDGNPTYAYVPNYATWYASYRDYSVWSLIEPDWTELYVYNSTLDTYVNADRSQWIANQVELYRAVYGLTNYGYSRIDSYTYADDDPDDWYAGSIKDFLTDIHYPTDNPTYSYTSLKTAIGEINIRCSLSIYAMDTHGTIWTDALLAELLNYIKTAEYNDEYVTVTDNMTAAEKFAQAKLLKTRAQEALLKISQGQKKINVNAYGFVFDKYFSHFTDQLESGCIIWVETQPGVIEQMHLSSFHIDYIDREISFTFGSKYNKYDINSLFEDVLGSVGKNAQTIKAQSDIIDDAVKNLSQVNNWIDNAQTLTANHVMEAKNQTVVIDESGYWGRMLAGYTVEGNPQYTDEQLKIINNGVYITDDNWENVATAIGKIKLPDDTYAYGVIGDVIIGKLLAGNNLKILANSSEDGITIYNGTETNKVFYADGNGNLTLSGNIIASGGSIAGWTIGQDSIYGSYNNGYTTYLKKPTGDNDNVIYVKKNNDTPFRVTGNGKLYATNADIKGSIYATTFIASTDPANMAGMKADASGLRFYYNESNLENPTTIPKITLGWNDTESDLYLGSGGGIDHTNRFLISKVSQATNITLWKASGITDNDGVRIKMSYDANGHRIINICADEVQFNGNLMWGSRS